MKKLIIAASLSILASSAIALPGPCSDPTGKALDAKGCAFQKAQAGQVIVDTSPAQMRLYPTTATW